MSYSHTYRFFVAAFVLIFSFSHVGYAAVEYICSMGMEMETSVCTNCHEGNSPAANTMLIRGTASFYCCTVVTTTLTTVDSYTYNPIHIHSIIESTIIANRIDVSDGDDNRIHYPEPFKSISPPYSLHGINTSIQYTSSLR